jgi:site-specific DNA-methyltransferase (adenine-specific)
MAFGGTRTYHRLACAIEDAGWEIFDCVMWLYGTGFPKSHNFGKRMNGTAEKWHGWGTALKPAWEPIICARKPCDGTFAANAEQWGVAGLWIDGGRVPTADPPWQRGGNGDKTGGGRTIGNYSNNKGLQHEGSPDGRWPANVMLDEDAAAMLDEEVGTRYWKHEKRTTITDKQPRTSDQLGGLNPATKRAYPSNRTSGTSRFFYVSKASRGEREKGLRGRMPCAKCGGIDTTHHKNERGEKVKCQRNNHPTVKALDLLRQLARLTKTPTGGVVLDPFAGSGTTGIACALEGREFIGFEMEQEYADIANARIAAWSEQETLQLDDNG